METQTRKQRLISINQLIGAELARLRRACGLNQVDVANSMGFKRPLVSKIENGQRALAAAEVCDYALALNMEPQALFALILSLTLEYDGEHDSTHSH